jgi:hypothetical protein
MQSKPKYIEQHFGGFSHQMKVCKPIGRQDSMQTVIRTSRRLDSFLHVAAQNFEVFSKSEIKKSKTYNIYVLFKAYPIVPLSCHVDPIWPDGPFKNQPLLTLFSARISIGGGLVLLLRLLDPAGHRGVVDPEPFGRLLEGVVHRKPSYLLLKKKQTVFSNICLFSISDHQLVLLKNIH